jgi:acetyltransferase EpsM
MWGASGHAKMVAEAARMSGKYEVAAFVDDRHPEREGERFQGATVLGTAEAARGLLERGVDQVHVAIGDSATRMRLAALVREWGFTLATVIHPFAIVSPSSTLGAGSFVGAGAILAADAHAGENVILNDYAGLGHDVVVEDGVTLAPRVAVAGGTVIERGAWIGMGTLIREGLRIGRESIVGAGSLVLRDVPERVVAFGSPARAVRAIGLEDRAAA